MTYLIYHDNFPILIQMTPHKHQSIPGLHLPSAHKFSGISYMWSQYATFTLYILNRRYIQGVMPSYLHKCWNNFSFFVNVNSREFILDCRAGDLQYNTKIVLFWQWIIVVQPLYTNRLDICVSDNLLSICPSIIHCLVSLSRTYLTSNQFKR